MRAVIRLLPVLVVVGLLLGLRQALPLSVPAGPEVEAARAAIREAVAEVPFLVEARLAGEEQPLPTPAMELLKPNAVLSRTYTDLSTGREYGFVIIHATDLNDMIGHYPPICYPSAGWTPLGGADGDEAPRQLTLELGFAELPVRLYRYMRLDALGREVEVRVLNGFILPDGSTSTDMETLRARAGRRALAAAGAAQFQMLVPAAYPEAEVVDAMEAIIRSAEPLVRQMGLGGEPAGAAEPATEGDDSPEGRST